MTTVTLEFPLLIRVDDMRSGKIYICFSDARQKWLGAWAVFGASTNSISTAEGASAEAVLMQLLASATQSLDFAAAYESKLGKNVPLTPLE